MEDEKTTSSYSGQFIKDCKEQFQNVSDHLLQNSILSEEEAHGVVEELFLRLLFLRFLEEKKWLVYQGNSNYLSALCNAGGIGLMSVYSSRFKPLFSNTTSTAAPAIGIMAAAMAGVTGSDIFCPNNSKIAPIPNPMPPIFKP